MIRWGNRQPTTRATSQRPILNEPEPINLGEGQRDRDERNDMTWDEWLRKSAQSIERVGRDAR